MTIYAGIDLGTTNSAISTYDGETVRTYKSTEQNDVTPSVLFYAKRGGLMVGQRAYESAARAPQSAASLFKRIMGTNTPIRVETSDGIKEMSPEECSAEVLRTLYSYLPEEARRSGDVVTVITVPAAFNTMQRDATMAAARMAGIGKVRLLQEPVAAVMSVMRGGNQSGTFVVFDLGGGTLDITVAESSNGRVNVQRNGGVQMLGGRDFDRLLVDNVVKPWLQENFDLPADFSTQNEYSSLIRIATWAAEKAKIELSSKDEVTISLDEAQANSRDASGEEIYLHIPLTRVQMDELIGARLEEAIDETRNTLEAAHLSFDQIERLVFVGGPTNYAPLRERVASELGIRGSTEVNPMTAVSEGAAIFAESAEWDEVESELSSSAEPVATEGVAVRFEERTPETTALVIAQFDDTTATHFVVFDNLDDGWTSGRIEARESLEHRLNLPLKGVNRFRIQVFGEGAQSQGFTMEFEIRRTTSTVESIPASHRVGVEVNDVNGKVSLVSLVEAGEPLPKTGMQTFRALRSITAGEVTSLRLKLWEGDIDDPVTDNRPIGSLQISGLDFEEGTIEAGSELHCEFEIKDSGEISLNVVVPAVEGVFNSSGRNLYSRTEMQTNFEEAHTRVVEKLNHTITRIERINEVLQSPELDKALARLSSAQDSIVPGDAESIQAAEESDLQAKRALAEVTKKNKTLMNRLKLADVTQEYHEHLEPHASDQHKAQVGEVFEFLEHDLEIESDDFDEHLSLLREVFSAIWFSQFDNVAAHFDRLAERPHLFNNPDDFEKLVTEGRQAVEKRDEHGLLRVLRGLYAMWDDPDDSDETMFINAANIGM